MKSIRKTALVLAVLFTACTVSACAKKAHSTVYAADAAYGEARYEPEPAPVFLAESASAGLTRKAAAGAPAEGSALNGKEAEPASYERKVVYNATLTMTVDDPRAALEAVSARCAGLGGYLSGSYERSYADGTIYVTATLKVPAEGLNDLLAELKTLGKTESSRMSSDDISQSYYDIEARLRAAKAEEEQLIALLEKCGNVEEMLAVREQLAYVRGDIESYQASINLWDHQVAYATVELTLNETPKTPAETDDGTVELWKLSDVVRKMKKGFGNSWRSVLNALGAIGIFLAEALLPVAVFGAIAFGIVKLVVAVRKKGAPKREARRLARLQKKQAGNKKD